MQICLFSSSYNPFSPFQFMFLFKKLRVTPFICPSSSCSTKRTVGETLYYNTAFLTFLCIRFSSHWSEGIPFLIKFITWWEAFNENKVLSLAKVFAKSRHASCRWKQTDLSTTSDMKLIQYLKNIGLTIAVQKDTPLEEKQSSYNSYN